MVDNMGSKIREARISQGLTLADLGDKVGTTPTTIRRWEKGLIKHMTSLNIQKVATALGLTPAYLMGWKENVEEHDIKETYDMSLKLKALMAELESSGALMFDGDPMSDEAKESIVSAMKIGLELARKKNKNVHQKNSP